MALTLKPLDGEAENKYKPIRSLPREELPEATGRRRRRRRGSASGLKRLRRAIAEQKRRIAVIIAIFVACGGALLVYSLIRPD